METKKFRNKLTCCLSNSIFDKEGTDFCGVTILPFRHQILRYPVAVAGDGTNFSASTEEKCVILFTLRGGLFSRRLFLRDSLTRELFCELKICVSTSTGEEADHHGRVLEYHGENRKQQGASWRPKAIVRDSLT